MTPSAAILPRAPGEGESVQAYARLAGVLGLITVVAGGFGEAYVPGAIFVAGDPAATAQRILGNEALFRWGFAGYLVEALCDAALTMVFWVLVRPVQRNLAMLMVVFRIVSTCGFGAAQVLYFGALPALRGAHTVAALQPAQMEALAYVLLRIAAFGGSLFSTFYGVANIVLGWLVHRSGYLPRVFGIAMILTGVAFVVRTFLLILAPAYASGLLLATAAVAFIPFILWLLVKGVDEEAWRRVVQAGDERARDLLPGRVHAPRNGRAWPARHGRSSESLRESGDWPSPCHAAARWRRGGRAGRDAGRRGREGRARTCRHAPPRRGRGFRFSRGPTSGGAARVAHHPAGGEPARRAPSGAFSVRRRATALAGAGERARTPRRRLPLELVGAHVVEQPRELPRREVLAHAAEACLEIRPDLRVAGMLGDRWHGRQGRGGHGRRRRTGRQDGAGRERARGRRTGADGGPRSEPCTERNAESRCRPVDDDPRWARQVFGTHDAEVPGLPHECPDGPVLPERMTTPAPHDLASCADVHAALLAACAARQAVEPGLARTPEALARRDAADRAITALARDFARCAREEPLRPELVLRALHAALDPLQRAIGYETRPVIRRAIDWYYATEAERRVSLRVTRDWEREAPAP